MREALPSRAECGNWNDEFPCKTCNAKTPRGCPRFNLDHKRVPA